MPSLSPRSAPTPRQTPSGAIGRAAHADVQSAGGQISRHPSPASTPVIRLYERIAATVAGGSAAPDRIADAHQPVCRQHGGSSRAQKVERGVCAVWPVDSLRDRHHGGFVFHPNAHRRPGHGECLLWRQTDYSGGHGGSRHGADRPATRPHRQQHQLDAGLAGRRGNATQCHRP